MAFLQPHQFAPAVVEIDREDLPAVLVDVEAALVVRVVEADPQVRVDDPDAVQLVAQQLGVERLRPDDGLVRDALLVHRITVVRHQHLALAQQVPFVAVRGAVVDVDHVRGGQAAGVRLQRLVGQRRHAPHAPVVRAVAPGLAGREHLVEGVLHHQRGAGQPGRRGDPVLVVQQGVVQVLLGHALAVVNVEDMAITGDVRRLAADDHRLAVDDVRLLAR